MQSQIRTGRPGQPWGSARRPQYQQTADCPPDLRDLHGGASPPGAGLSIRALVLPPVQGTGQLDHLRRRGFQAQPAARLERSRRALSDVSTSRRRPSSGLARPPNVRVARDTFPSHLLVKPSLSLSPTTPRRCELPRCGTARCDMLIRYEDRVLVHARTANGDGTSGATG